MTGFSFAAWQLWVIAGLLFSIAELIGTQFVLLAVGIACLGGAAVAGFTDLDFDWQLGVTVALTVVMVPLFVWFYRQRLQPLPRGVAGEGGERGATATVITQGDRLLIRYKGDSYPVRTENGRILHAGEQVQIVRFDGITAIVIPLEQGIAH